MTTLISKVQKSFTKAPLRSILLMLVAVVGIRFLIILLLPLLFPSVLLALAGAL